MMRPMEPEFDKLWSESPPPGLFHIPHLTLGKKSLNLGREEFPVLCRNFIYCDICIIISVFLFFVGLV